MVSFLARYAKVTGAYEKVSEDLSSFSDRDRISSYAVESMQWAVANGFILGTETGKLEPWLRPPCSACRQWSPDTARAFTDFYPKRRAYRGRIAPR